MFPGTMDYWGARGTKNRSGPGTTVRHRGDSQERGQVQGKKKKYSGTASSIGTNQTFKAEKGLNGPSSNHIDTFTDSRCEYDRFLEKGVY